MGLITEWIRFIYKKKGRGGSVSGSGTLLIVFIRNVSLK